MMSSQRGNVKKCGPPKHQNKTAFRNDLHDSTIKQKIINNLNTTGLCTQCTQVIEWKIKYKKYNPLTKAKTCVSCSQKTVKKAYHVLCCDCAEKKKACAKCQKEIQSEIDEDCSTSSVHETFFADSK